MTTINNHDQSSQVPQGLINLKNYKLELEKDIRIKELEKDIKMKELELGIEQEKTKQMSIQSKGSQKSSKYK